MTTTRLFDAAAFARRLGERRAANGQTQRQVADAVGVSTATICRVEAGWPDLSHENFLRLSDWLDAGRERKRA